MGSPVKILEFEKTNKMHGFLPFVEGTDEVGNLHQISD